LRAASGRLCARRCAQHLRRRQPPANACCVFLSGLSRRLGQAARRSSWWTWELFSRETLSRPSSSHSCGTRSGRLRLHCGTAGRRGTHTSTRKVLTVFSGAVSRDAPSTRAVARGTAVRQRDAGGLGAAVVLLSPSCCCPRRLCRAGCAEPPGQKSSSAGLGSICCVRAGGAPGPGVRAPANAGAG